MSAFEPRAPSSLAPHPALAVALAIAMLLAAGPAAADDKAVCADAYERSQDLRDEGKLVLARAQLLTCESACPATLTPDCMRWRREVEQQLASVVLRAKDRHGRVLLDAKVFIDGKPVADWQSDRPVDLDPGPHTIRFERAGETAAEETIDVKKGDKGVAVVGFFGAAQPALPPHSTTPHPPAGRELSPAGEAGAPTGGPTIAVVVLGALGISGLAAAAVLTIKGHLDRQELYECSPSCAPDRIDSVRTTWLGAGISAGVGTAALLAAAVVWSTAPRAKRAAELSFGLSPARAHLRGRF